MATAEIDVQAVIIRLRSLTIFELRGEWRRHHQMSPPPRLSRDLLIRGIAYKIQEQAFGGLPKATVRRIARMSTRVSDCVRAGTAAAPPAQITLKPGTRLVREWHGQTHSVLVNADGFEWRDQRFASLSKVAHAITGAHWSGPRFFGLKRRAEARPVQRGDD
jgi:hypothetical protein